MASGREGGREGVGVGVEAKHVMQCANLLPRDSLRGCCLGLHLTEGSCCRSLGRRPGFPPVLRCNCTWAMRPFSNELAPARPVRAHYAHLPLGPPPWAPSRSTSCTLYYLCTHVNPFAKQLLPPVHLRS